MTMSATRAKFGKPAVMVALSVLAFTGSLIYAWRSARRLARSREILETVAVQAGELAPLARRWEQYREVESRLAQMSPPEVPLLPDDFPSPETASTNRVLVSGGWEAVEWRGDWPDVEFSRLPELFVVLQQAGPAWIVSELRIEPAGDASRGRLTVAMEALTKE